MRNFQPLPCFVSCSIAFAALVTWGPDVRSQERETGEPALRPILVLEKEMRDLSGVTNGLGLGIHRTSVSGLLRYGRRAENIKSLHVAKASESVPYDHCERWRLWETGRKQRAPFPGELWLYYRNEFLLGKCIVPAKDQRTAETVHTQEIQSGRQHPPADRALMRQVRWGKSQELSQHRKVNKQNLRERVRCGIVLDERSVFARKYGYNVLVLLQNVGENPIDEELAYFFFFGGPRFRLLGRSRTKDEETLSLSLFWGGVATKKRKDVVVKLLNSATGRRMYPEGSKERASLENEAISVAAVRLAPSQCIYGWFKVEELSKYKSLQGQLSAFGVLKELREWKAKSGILQLVRSKK